ncbi:MAG: choice-of-anchor J domain-containing protein [Candidatus Delongbacteria bacterium]|nr:choice-of-anchor J domain-containing protein [Candidatus Delongbacteria bacterium]
MRVLLAVNVIILMVVTLLEARPELLQRDELSEDFENGIPFSWLVVDQDASGSSWNTVRRDDGFLTYGNSEQAVGCRYNSDGSQNDDWLITPRLLVPDSTRTISFYAASQDLNPDYLESFEILVSHTRVNAANFDPELFELVATYNHIPSTMLQYSFDTAPEFLGDTIHVAVRCISHDDYYLIVDHFQGVEIAGDTSPQLVTWPTAAEWIDLGPFEVDEVVTDTVWVGNLGGDTLYVRVALPGTDIDETLILSAFTLEAIPFTVYSVVPERIHRAINIFWGYEQPQEQLLQTGYAGLAFYPDSSYTLEDFEDQVVPDDWDASYHHNDSPGWQVTDHSSSMFFSIPAHSWYAFINSDAQGEEATQDDWLISPPLDLTGADQLLYLTWESFFDDYAGGTGQLLWTLDPQPTPESNWHLIINETGTDTLWTRQWFRVPDTLWNEPVRLGFHFTGQWSQGWAIDNIQLLRDVIVEEVADNSLPRQLELLPPYPNPFNAELTIPLQLAVSTTVRLQLYDLLGRLAWQLEAPYKSGEHLIRVQVPELASGLYLLRGATVEQGRVSLLPASHKVILLK